MLASLAGLVLAASSASVARAADALVAVASNFSGTAAQIAERFRRQTGHSVVLTPASSGKLYAQIVNGAPYDAFLSADVERAKKLEQDGLVAPGSRFTYAVGRLALWSRAPRYRGKDCQAELQGQRFNRLALANPQTAPYGTAALQVLEALGLKPATLEGRLVYGENIAQTLQFVDSGSADLGFVALAQVRQVGEVARSGTCLWEVPMQSHAPIQQQAVLLKKSAGNAAAAGYLAFLATAEMRKLIEAHGYSTEH